MDEGQRGGPAANGRVGAAATAGEGHESQVAAERADLQTHAPRSPLLLPFQVALGSEMLRNQLQVTQPMREQLPQSPTGVGAVVKAARRKGREPALRALSG